MTPTSTKAPATAGLAPASRPPGQARRATWPCSRWRCRARRPGWLLPTPRGPALHAARPVLGLPYGQQASQGGRFPPTRGADQDVTDAPGGGVLLHGHGLVGTQGIVT